MEQGSVLLLKEMHDVPYTLDSTKTVLRLLPKTSDDAYYAERTDRNIGWITKEEQEQLRHKVVGIAGCGGMGAQLAEKFLRLGVGEIRIADCETFDISNINRQFAAGHATVGVSKALATARMLREITEDSTVVVYPQGICEQTVMSFVEGCDVICDEIEFHAVGPRILLHHHARRAGVSVFNCNTVGFGTRLFLFTPHSVTIEEVLGFSLEEAMAISRAVEQKKATKEMRALVIDRMLVGLVPDVPTYAEGEQDRDAVMGRLYNEGKASIIATNPPMASGVVADRVLLEVLHRLGLVSREKVVPVPEMPGYLYIDIALMKARVVSGRKWWNRGRRKK